MKFFILVFLGLLVSSTYAGLQDPTRPSDYVDATNNFREDQLELTAIINSPNRKIAVISGKIFKEGDEIAGMKVILIKENAVEIKSANNNITLFLLKSSVKQDLYKKDER